MAKIIIIASDHSGAPLTKNTGITIKPIYKNASDGLGVYLGDTLLFSTKAQEVCFNLDELYESIMSRRETRRTNSFS